MGEDLHIDNFQYVSKLIFAASTAERLPLVFSILSNYPAKRAVLGHCYLKTPQSHAT